METSNSSLIVILMEERERRFWIFCFFYHLPFKHLKHTPLTPVDQQELQYWTHCIVWMNFLCHALCHFEIYSHFQTLLSCFSVWRSSTPCVTCWLLVCIGSVHQCRWSDCVILWMAQESEPRELRPTDVQVRARLQLLSAWWVYTVLPSLRLCRKTVFHMYMLCVLMVVYAIAFNGNPSQSCISHMSHRITVLWCTLPPDAFERALVNPGMQFTYPRGTEGWVDLGGWLYTKILAKKLHCLQSYVRAVWVDTEKQQKWFWG